jgi:hypothetical protein
MAWEHAKGRIMPNFISNALKVTKGDPQQVWAAISGKDAVRGDTVFDPNRLIPVSGEYPDAHHKAWGTMYVDEAKIIQQSRLIFTTAWTPPYKVIKKIISMFPEHEFEFGCSDIQTGKSFDWTGINGEMSNFKETRTVIIMDHTEKQVIETLAAKLGGKFDINDDVEFSATEDFEDLDNRVHQFVTELNSRAIHFN